MVEEKKVTKVEKPEKKTPKKEGVVNFAIIETGGKQYIVQSGDKIRVEKIEKPAKGNTIVFDSVLLISKNGKLAIGEPYVEGAKVKAEWLDEIRDRKIKNVKYKSKTRQYRRQGHRQTYTEVLIGDF